MNLTYLRVPGICLSNFEGAQLIKKGILTDFFDFGTGFLIIAPQAIKETDWKTGAGAEQLFAQEAILQEKAIIKNS